MNLLKIANLLPYIRRVIFFRKFSLTLIFLLTSGLVIYTYQNIVKDSDINNLISAKTAVEKTNLDLETKLVGMQKELEELKSEDQVQINKNLNADLKNIHDAYQNAVLSYEKLLNLKSKTKDTSKLDKLFANTLKYLSDKNYSSASGTLKDLDSHIKEEEDKIATSFKIPENVPLSSTPPSSGYRRQQVQTDQGTFLVDIVSADLNTTRVVVDTASDSDCTDNCPVLSLSEYVSRNGAYAGINGSYFCPQEYPSCSGKTNSFDTLLMNKNKKYFNSDNNVYSTVPAAIFYGNSARFVTQSLEWGRDTSADAVIANYPLLTLGNQIVFNGSSEQKHNSRGPRCFLGATGSTVYIGIVHNATMSNAAKVVNTIGIADALNLDEGGSTALWHGGYKAGPGRNIPNAVLFVKR